MSAAVSVRSRLSDYDRAVIARTVGELEALALAPEARRIRGNLIDAAARLRTILIWACD